jgi:hypothetical protein
MNNTGQGDYLHFSGKEGTSLGLEITVYTAYWCLGPYTNNGRIK